METRRSADAFPFHKDVHNFIKAADTSLSPGRRTSPLTPDECEIIKEYVITVSNVKEPWGNSLPVMY